jgi:signal transduction histidine kinase
LVSSDAEMMTALRYFVFGFLLLGAGLIARQYHTRHSREDLVREVQRNLSGELDAIEQEANILLSDSISPSNPLWDNSHHFFVRLDDGKVSIWNRTWHIPEQSIADLDSPVSFVRTSRGDLIIRTWIISPTTRLAAVLKITDRFPIINNYLSPQWEPTVFPVRDCRVRLASETPGDAIRYHDQILFKLEPPPGDRQESGISFVCLCLSLIALSLALWNMAQTVGLRWSHEAGFLFLTASFWGVRLGMLQISFPALFIGGPLFDPATFASSAINASLGDLFLNAVTLLIPSWYLFNTIKQFASVRWALRRSGIVQFMVGTLLLLVCFYAFAFPYDFIEAIYHNSSISLDSIQTLVFSPARIGAVLAVLLGCIAGFLFLHAVYAVAVHLLGDKKWIFATGLMLAAVLYAIQFVSSGRSLWFSLVTGAIFFMVLRLLNFQGRFQVSFRLFVYLILSLSFLSVQNAWGVRVFYSERQSKDQFRFGKDFLTDRDVLGEYLLDQASRRIQSDQFIQTRMSSPFLSKTAVADKIRRVYLSNYFDRYEVTITTRPAAEAPPDSLLGVSAMPFQSTGYSGITYASATGETAIKRYRVIIPIYYQRPAGWIDLDLTLKRLIPDNVYPELLVDNRFSQMYRNRDFSYALYRSGQLLTSSGPFNYEREFPTGWLANRDLYDLGVQHGQYFHAGLEDGEGFVAVVSAQSYGWFYFAANFSFWFLLGLVVLFAGQGILGVISLVQGIPVNYSARIQWLVFLAFLLPVSAVSITTLTLMGKSNEQNITADFQDRARSLSQRLVRLAGLDSASGLQSLELESWMEENALGAKTDVTVYRPDGGLLATSQPALFENQLIATRMDRQAWRRIVLNHEAEAVTSEEIGKLQYNCAYSAVRSPETGALLGIVALPFFESATFLEKSQSLIISNILIVFVLVFVLFSWLGYWASNSLTFPIRFIARMIGQTTQQGRPKPLEWNSSDEIGTLVKEYNRMVENLDASQRALARSEKENAWREMAKQVAHEIKNPLTPMKLTLQQMEQALKTDQWSPERSRKSVDMLLKQVEILNSISVSFSTFANMPVPSPQVVALNPLITSTCALFESAAEGKVLLETSSSEVQVSVDPTSMSRAVSNLIINALQAGREGQQNLTVLVGITPDENGVMITISDNGKGMTEEVRAQVFQPHFTTKKSGSGLGLAMTRQIIQQAGGRISFTSKEGEGTRFEIVLPTVLQ